MRDQPIERLGNRCLDASCRRWRALHALHQVSKGALADCGQPSAYEHVVQDQAERIYVGALIDRFAQSLLRSHVLERANHRARCRSAGEHCLGVDDGRARDAEVHDQRMVTVDHDVGRLQIAMHDADFVRSLEPGGNLPGNDQRSRNSELSSFSQHRRQVPPLDVRHRDVLDAVDLTQIVNPNDVLVCNLPGQQQLALEPPLDIEAGRSDRTELRPNHFERNSDAELVVPGLVHGAHAADAERPDDVVSSAECLAGRERTSCSENPCRAGASSAARGVRRDHGELVRWLRLGLSGRNSLRR